MVKTRKPMSSAMLHHPYPQLAGIRSSLLLQSAVLCLPGPTLRDYDDGKINPIVPRLAVGCAVKKTLGRTSFWFVEGNSTYMDFGKYVPAAATAFLSGQAEIQAGRMSPHLQPTSAKRIGLPMGNLLPVAASPEPPFRSYGEHLIAVIETVRYLGVEELFIYGLDLFREVDAYYYCARKPLGPDEQRCAPAYQVKKTAGYRIYSTPRLTETRKRLEEVVAAKAWEGLKIWVVGSPWTQAAGIFAKMSAEDAATKLARIVPRRDPEPVEEEKEV